MNHLIIGAGEVGTSLYEVLKEKYFVRIKDKDNVEGQFDVLHICFPYDEKFIDNCKDYFNQYNPKLVIIHSTVKPGTTLELGEYYVYSPIRGKHPRLAQGIRTFKKYFGGIDPDRLNLAWEIFYDINIAGMVSENPTEIELLKILETTYYGWNIVFCKEVKKICDEYGVEFPLVYTHANKTYNKGYVRMGNPEFVRPILDPADGKIGGHCVVQNCHLLDSDITNYIIKKNDEY